VEVERADRADLAAADLAHEVAHEDGDAGRHVAGVVAVVHRGGAGVVGLAAHGELGPGDALDARHRTDVDALRLQHRPLLDVQLDEGVGRGARQGSGPPVADAVELRPEDRAVDGDHVERLLERHAAGVDQAAQHVGWEAGALLVGEEGDGDGRRGTTPWSSRVSTTSSPASTPRLPS
jgi:hypothetical protein